MEKRTIWMYPGYLTKGLKGKLLWHPKTPTYNEQERDWITTGSIDITGCIHDPWPFGEGGKEFVLEVTKQ